MKKLIIDIGGTHLRYSFNYNSEFDIVKIKSSKNILKDIKNIINCSDININICNISIGGIIDQGEIINVNNIGKWNKINLKVELNKIFPLIEFNIENDGNCAAIAEKYEGFGINKKSFVTFVLGTGVGIGIFFNDKLIKLSEIGIYIEDKFCGKKFENLSDKKKIKELYLKGAEILSYEIIRFINIFNIFNFIISGPISKNVFFFENLEKRVKKKCNLIFKNKINIYKSQIKEQGLIGAKYLSMNMIE